jgi:hypothetical protein
MAQYLLLLHQDPHYNTDLPREKMMEMTRRYIAWADGLREKGKLLGGEKLTASGGRQLRTAAGKLVTSDGPYAETKDVVGGYFVIAATDLAVAVAITRDCPHFALAPSNWAEVRPIEDMAQVRAAAG